MPENRHGPVLRTLRSVWDALNFTRLLIFNILFLLVLGLVVGWLFSARPVLGPHTALVLDPNGAIVEQYSIDPAARALGKLGGNGVREVQLRDLLRVIEVAAKDSRIDRIVLMPDEITDIGLATARDLGIALDRFRSTGKDIVAVSAGMDQNSYLLAAHANRILLDPEGSVLLEGLASYRSYYKDALDKLGVNVHLIKVGQYKSAAEPYVLNQASDAAKQASQFWMGGIWRDYLDQIAHLRKVDVDVLADDIAHYADRVSAHQGDLARLALDEKLVDSLATRGEARSVLRKLGAPADADGDGFRQIDYKDYLATVGATPKLVGEEVAIVVAQGEIMPGERPQGSIGGKSTARLIRAAREDDHVKALVLRVDSPGGDATASEMIRREVAQTRAAGKPVIVSMGDVAASGGYWISMNADEIWAEPETITGSIGIFGLFVTIPDTLAKLGIHTDGIGTTPLAGALDIRRPLSPEVESILTDVIERGYRQFVGRVAKARGRTPAQIDAIAQGRVWSGSQAKARGLVDHLGGLDEAVAAAARRAKLGADYRTTYVEKPLSPWENLALSLSNDETLARLVRASGIDLPRALTGNAELRQIDTLLDLLRSKRYGIFARCFCELR
ncbi:MAG: signal peptide peptidase SppA [Rhodanobacteraceae bacterium]